MIIGISGKIGSGKDTLGTIIQYLFYLKSDIDKDDKLSYESFIKIDKTNNLQFNNIIPKIKKFADPLKDIICLLTGCTRDELENEDFKNSKLSNEWIRYGYADGFSKKFINGCDINEPTMNFKECSKERYEQEVRTNWQTAYKQQLTYRDLLQYLGTDLLRNQLHENVWINSVLDKYKPTFCNIFCIFTDKSKTNCIHCLNLPNWILTDVRFYNTFCTHCLKLPNWIITDVRFPNEVEAIKNKDGVNIKINRPINLRFPELWRLYSDQELSIEPDEEGFFKWLRQHDAILFKKLIHESEIALDNYKFDYIIENDMLIEKLILRVKKILQIEQLI